MRPLTTLIAIVLAGAAAGVLAKMADESTIGWASDLGTHPAIWIGAAAVIGRLAPSVAWAAGRATAFFVAMTLAYYASSSLVFGFPLDRWVVTWSVLAVTAVPVLAAATWWATRRPGAVPGVLIGALAATILAGGSINQAWLYALGELPADFPVRPVQALTDLATAVVVAGILPVHRSTRVTALVLAPLLAPLAAIGLSEGVGRFLG
jgi:hypothetical protein